MVLRHPADTGECGERERLELCGDVLRANGAADGCPALETGVKQSTQLFVLLCDFLGAKHRVGFVEQDCGRRFPASAPNTYARVAFATRSGFSGTSWAATSSSRVLPERFSADRTTKRGAK